MAMPRRPLREDGLKECGHEAGERCRCGTYKARRNDTTLDVVDFIARPPWPFTGWGEEDGDA